jgi:hypothetical protein
VDSTYAVGSIPPAELMHFDLQRQPVFQATTGPFVSAFSASRYMSGFGDTWNSGPVQISVRPLSFPSNYGSPTFHSCIGLNERHTLKLKVTRVLIVPSMPSPAGSKGIVFGDLSPSVVRLSSVTTQRSII